MSTCERIKLELILKTKYIISLHLTCESDIAVWTDKHGRRDGHGVDEHINISLDLNISQELVSLSA